MSPRMLLTLWPYAVSEGVGSAREIERRVETDVGLPRRSRARRRMMTKPIVAWRERMQTDEAKEIYRARASLCELPNAHFKSRLGLSQFLVRG